MFGTLFGFAGRLSRAGYIEALLSIVLIDIAAGLIATYAQTYGLAPLGYGPHDPTISAVAGWQPLAFGVLTAWALLATSVKRCHDRGKSGWWLLLGFILVFGWLWLLIDLVLRDGSKGTNKYGRQPHSHEPIRPWAPEPVASAPAVEIAPAAAASAVAHSEDQGPAATPLEALAADHHEDVQAPAEIAQDAAEAAHHDGAHQDDGGDAAETAHEPAEAHRDEAGHDDSHEQAPEPEADAGAHAGEHHVEAHAAEAHAEDDSHDAARGHDDHGQADEPLGDDGRAAQAHEAAHEPAHA